MHFTIPSLVLHLLSFRYRIQKEHQTLFLQHSLFITQIRVTFYVYSVLYDVRIDIYELANFIVAEIVSHVASVL